MIYLIFNFRKITALWNNTFLLNKSIYAISHRQERSLKPETLYTIGSINAIRLHKESDAPNHDRWILAKKNIAISVAG